MNGIRGISGFREVVAGPQSEHRNAGGTSFGQMLSNFLDDVNNLQKEAGTVTQKAVTGDVEDVHQVMIAAQKAAISLQLAAEIRNKVLEGYQELMRMQV